MLAFAALVLGIGSCQLPQPRLPQIPVGGIGDPGEVGGVAATGVASIGAARASTPGRGDRT